MARPTTLNYEEIKQGLIDKGFDITEVKRDKGTLKIFAEAIKSKQYQRKTLAQSSNKESSRKLLREK